ncbi:MAG TPA: Ig-like domain repeat protein, partial [Dyadobacter sp.]|nr:Ig-like domain repeat protein [Dyadobacter sp.]
MNSILQNSPGRNASNRNRACKAFHCLVQHALVLLSLATLVPAYAVNFTAATTTTISPLSTICASSVSGTITATVSPDPDAGTIQFKIDGNNVGAPVAVSNGSATLTYNPSTFTAGNHDVTAVFSVAGSLTGSTSPAVVLTLNGITPGTISKGATNPGPACAPLNPNQTLAPTSATMATGTASSITYLWEQSVDGGPWTPAIPETSNTSAQFNPASMNATTRLRRIATSTVNGVSCSAVSNELEYIVYPLPVVASITPTSNINICVGATIQLSNTTAGGVWSVNNSSNVTVNSTGLVTGISPTPPTPPAISPNISYTVTSSNGCIRRVNRAVNVRALPIVTSAASVCIGNNFSLTPDTGGTWTSNNPTIATVTNAVVVTGIAEGSATFTFKASAATGCSNTTSTVAVTAKPKATINSVNTSVCEGVSANITGTVTATGAWTLTLSNGSTATGTDNGSFSIPVTPSSNTTYTLTSLMDAGCSAGNLDLTGSTSVVINPIPIAPSVAVNDNCDETSTLTASDYTGTLLWSNSETTPAITVTAAGSYSVTQTVNGCESMAVSAIASPKNAPATPTVTSPKEYCKDEVASTLTATGTDLLWYENATAGIGDNTAPLPQTSVAGTTVYYVSQAVDGCESDRAAIEVVIKGDCSPMPVKLSEFKVKTREQSVLISWKTTSESNSDRFEIERSIAIKNGFTKIAIVKSNDVESGANYQIEDTQYP